MGSRKTLSIGITVNLEHYENLRLELNGEVDSPEDADELVAYLDTVLGQMGRRDPATAERIDSYRRRVLLRKAPEPVPAGCQDGVCPLPADILAEVTGAGTGAVNAPHKKPAASHPAPWTGTAPSSPGSSAKSGPSAPGTAGRPSPPVSSARSGPSTPGTAGKPSPGPAPSPVSPPGPPIPSATPAKSPSAPGHTYPPGEKPLNTVKSGVDSSVQNPLPSGGLTCEECGAPITETERKMSQLFASRTLCRSCTKKTG